MTRREMFETIATVNADNTEIVEFCMKEIAILDKRNAEKKPSKTQLENEVLKEAILTYLAEIDKPVTVSEIIEECEAVAGMKNQKVTALLTQLKKAKRVTNSKEGKKSVYSFGYSEE